MIRGSIITTKVALVVFLLVIASNLWAFPDREITGVTGGPPLDFGFTDVATSFFLEDDRTLCATYGQKLAVADLAFYELFDEQPFDISADEDTEIKSPFLGAAYISSTDEVLVTQERGHALLYSMSDPAAEPVDIIIEEGKKLGAVVINTNETFAYLVNNSDGTIHQLDLASLAVVSIITVTIPNQSGFVFTDGVFVSSSGEAFFSTDRGAVVVLPDQGTSTTIVDVDTLNGDNLTAIDVTPNGSFVYVTDSTFNELIKIDVGTLNIVAEIDLIPNTSPVDVAALNVTNPNTTYIYVAGGDGVSVVDMNSNVVLDLGDGTDDHEPIPTSAAPKMLAGSTDGYVYLSLSTLSVGVISENPWVTIRDVVYSGGGSTLGQGGTVTITFLSNENGTYELRAGGDVDRSGSVLVDSSGNTSGSIVADTDTAVEIPYDDNSAAFDEGDNDVFVFVTDGDGNVGRHALTVTVDTPPDVVTLRSAGFGSERVYVTFDRLTASDMDHYNIYVDPDPDAVITKADVDAEVAQPLEGSAVTGSVGELTNGTTYYIAVEGVDAGGNVSPSRAITLPIGARASATPQGTEGPAGFAGEKGCIMMPQGERGTFLMMLLFLFALIPVIGVRVAFSGSAASSGGGGGERSFTGSPAARDMRDYVVERVNEKEPSPTTRRRYLAMLALIAVFSVVSLGEARAEQEPSPQWWSFELKTGFWMPTASKTKRFFDSCCNLITRAQGGLLAHGRYGAELSVGFMLKDGGAIGMETGEASYDRFSFFILPIETNFVWRLDYWKWRYLVPYIKTGIDYVYFRENVSGDVIEGVKYGMHGVGGLQIPLSPYSDGVAQLDQQYGLNDISFIMEAQYQWINDFGGGGLDLSGWLFSAGFLFTF